MEVLQGVLEGPQLLHLGTGVVALLLTVLTVRSLPSLTNYWRQWRVMKPIPGISPCYPLLGNALLLEPDGEGKGSSCWSPAVRSLHCTGLCWRSQH